MGKGRVMEHNRGHKALLELGFEYTINENSGTHYYVIGNSFTICFMERIKCYNFDNILFNHMVTIEHHKAIHLWLKDSGWLNENV